MAEKFEETAIIIRQEEIADDIYSMWLHTDQIAAHAKAGQFVSVYCNGWKQTASKTDQYL